MPTIDDVTVLAAGTTTRRSLEDRFFEVVNVRDFGALGNDDGGGSVGHDDTTNIQAAIDWTAGLKRGCIYFPPGIYRVTAPLTFNIDSGAQSIMFKGEGLISQIVGTVNGYIIDRNVTNGVLAINAFEDLYIVNYHSAVTSGCIRWGAGIGVHINNCALYGFNGFTSSAGLFGLTINGCQFGTSIGYVVGTIGILVISGGPTLITGCNIIGMDKGVYVLFGGATIIGCRFETNNYGVYASTSAILDSCSFEANTISVYMHGGNFSHFKSCGVLGDAFQGAQAVKSGDGTLGSNVIEVTDTSGINIGMSVSDNTGVLTDWWAQPTGYLVTAIDTPGPNQVTLSKPAIGTAVYPGITKTGCACTIGSPIVTMANTAGIVPGMFAEDEFQYVLLTTSSSFDFNVISVDSGTQVTLSNPATISIDPTTIYFGTTFRFNTVAVGGFLLELGIKCTITNCAVVGYFSDYLFKLVANDVLMSNCFAQDSFDTSDDSRKLIVDPPAGTAGYRIRTEYCNFNHAMTFATLPSTSLVAPNTEYLGPVQGEKLFISDGSTEAIGSPVTSGSSSTFMEVMWNGTAWTRSA